METAKATAPILGHSDQSGEIVTARQLFGFHGGIHPPANKSRSNAHPIAVPPLPERLEIALRQHLGQPALPAVMPGERVLKGQKLADADGSVSAAVHAPTSGTVIAIEPRQVAHPSGLADPCIVLLPDGEESWIARRPFTVEQATAFETRAYLQEMGIVGLGGAVFPSHLKLGGGQDGLATLVINGAECEPYISCDDRLMRERAAEIVEGIVLMRSLTRARTVLVGIEDDKPEAIAAMRAAAHGHAIEVVAVPTRYPSGGAKQLIRLLTGIEVASGVRSTDLGVQCFNVGTAYAVARAIHHGEPLLSRIVTLTGAVARPGNVEALIGTPVEHLLQFAGAESDLDGVIMGGPMMGFTLPSLSVGISKASNCLIAKTRAEFPPLPPARACIRCGECAVVCPAELQPQQLYWFAKSKQFGRAQEWNLFDCIECGACAYVCPSDIALVDYYRFAKSEIWAAEKQKKAADLARERHEFRQFRLERERQEKAARLATKAVAKLDDPDFQDPEKQAKIRAALERHAARQAPATPTPEPTAPTPTDDAETKRAAIEAAMARAAKLREEQATPRTRTEEAAVPAPDAAAPVDPKRAAIEAAMARAAKLREEQATPRTRTEEAAVPAPDAAAPVDPKRAAIEAAMARAVKLREEQATPRTRTEEAAVPAPDAAAPVDPKRAAIEAAMARAAKLRAEQVTPRERREVTNNDQDRDSEKS
ncbi:electron transport complex subunit RsxC [Chitinimonas lacunae]|uniref:Ion-translocating oxidoreductase complex subunit C n=1 Tax=Chitinimonas lacunae TaxID=1963018 RepID=A0ABV8MUQ1_9NEIS